MILNIDRRGHSGVFNIFDKNLSASAMLVWFYLVSCADSSGRAWPSLNTISRKCKLSKPTVIRALRELETEGILERTARKRLDGSHDTTLYVLKGLAAASSSSVRVPETVPGGSKAALPVAGPAVGPCRTAGQGVVKPTGHPKGGSKDSHPTLVKDPAAESSAGAAFPGEAWAHGVVKPLYYLVNQVDPNNIIYSNVVVVNRYSHLMTTLPVNTTEEGQPGLSGNEVNIKSGKEVKSVAAVEGTAEVIARIREVAGVEVTEEFAGKILAKYGKDRVNACIEEMERQIKRGIVIRYTGSWLRRALERNYQPDRPAKVLPFGKVAKSKAQKQSAERAHDQKAVDLKKEFIRSLYA